MSLSRRLAVFFFLLALLAGGVLWITRESQRPHESNQERGLRWLKEEYQLNEAAFLKAAELHRAYYAQCDQMCLQVKEASRPLLMRPRQPPSHTIAAGLREQERKLCDKCEETARHHLHQVARLMAPEQGRRFLNDMLAALEQQRLLHDLETSPPRPRR